jgi:MFS family permease
MARAVPRLEAKSTSTASIRMAAVSWLLTATFYFYQFALRSAPGVMMPELSRAFNISALGVASIAGLFYYGYSPFSLVAGAAMDRIGARRLLPGAAAAAGIGALLFATGLPALAGAGRFLQGAGGVFGLVGAIHIATKSFAPSKAATLIGASQMFGMAGAAAGRSVVGPLVARGLQWNTFWIAMGVAGLAIALLLLLLLPKDTPQKPKGNWFDSAASAFAIVFRNPQSILCGLIAGLIFMPTNIFDMTWGVQYLQEGHDLEFGAAVIRSASVPVGWIIGCPLLGLFSDRIGKRKPVILGASAVLFFCLAWILYGTTDVFSPKVIGLIAGIASGSAMLLYTVIKEVNPPQLGGTAIGVVNFLNFTLSALLAPLFAWILQNVSGAEQTELQHYQTTFVPLFYGVGVAMLLTLLLKETGSAVRAPSPKLRPPKQDTMKENV